MPSGLLHGTMTSKRSLRAMEPKGTPHGSMADRAHPETGAPPDPARREGRFPCAFPARSVRGRLFFRRWRFLDYLADGFFKGISLIFSMEEEVWTAVFTTLKLSGLSMVVTLLLGVPGGFCLGYFSFPGKKILRVTVDTLLSIPTVVVGLFVYAFISNRGPLGQYGLLFTIPGMAIGQTILALPIVLALTASAVETMDSRLRFTLLTLGAGGKRLLLSTLWESRHQILLAAVTAYGRVTAEVGVSMMIGGNIKWHTRTITTAITLETGKGEFSTGVALGLLLLALSFVLNWSLAFLRRRTES